MPRKKRFCPSCDTPAIITARHCDNCGLLLPWAVPLPTSPVAAPAPSAAPALHPVPVPTLAPAPVAAPPSAPSAQWPKALAAGAGVLLGLYLLALLIARPDTNDFPPPPIPTIPIAAPRLTATPFPTPFQPIPTARPIIPVGQAEELKIVSALASTNLSKASSAEFAIDGKDSTFWQAKYGEQGTAWIQLQMPERMIIRTLGIDSSMPIHNILVTFDDGSIQRPDVRKTSGFNYIDVKPTRSDQVTITFDSVYDQQGHVVQHPPEIHEIQVLGEPE